MVPCFLKFRSNQILETLKGYSRQDFFRDLTAGLTVGIVALPLAMAFAIASGVDPRAGIYTAIIAGFIISATGGSRVQIGGPTGAFVAIVYGVIAQYGLPNLVLCTIMAGVILLIMGFARMGTMIKYIPHPVTTGFTCGIAVLIFSTQIKDFFGLHIEKLPADFIGKFIEAGKAVGHEGAKAFSWHTFVVAAGSLAVIALWPCEMGTTRAWVHCCPGACDRRNRVFCSIKPGVWKRSGHGSAGFLRSLPGITYPAHFFCGHAEFISARHDHCVARRDRVVALRGCGRRDD